MKVDVPKNDLNIFSQLPLTARLLTNIKVLTRSCGLMDKASDFYYNECRHPKIAGSSPATIKQRLVLKNSIQFQPAFPSLRCSQELRILSNQMVFNYYFSL